MAFAIGQNGYFDVTQNIFFKSSEYKLQVRSFYSNLAEFEPFYSFFTSPYQPSLLEVERTSKALNAGDVR